VLRRAFLDRFRHLGCAVFRLTAFAASRPDAASLVYGLAVAAYSIGHLICHQLPARSFHLWGAALPVCARCSGIYFGAAIAALVRAARFGGQVGDGGLMSGGHARARIVLLLAFVPTAATLVFEWTTGVTPAHWIRALAGIPLGVAVAWAVGMVN
jgi:hypothetical protein